MRPNTAERGGAGRAVEYYTSSSTVDNTPSPTPTQALSPRPIPSTSLTYPTTPSIPIKNQHPSSYAQSSNALPSRVETNTALSHPPPMRVSYTSPPISSLPSSTPSSSSPTISMAPSSNNSLEVAKVNTTVWLKEKEIEDTQFNATDFADSDVTDYFKRLTVCMQGRERNIYLFHTIFLS